MSRRLRYIIVMALVFGLSDIVESATNPISRGIVPPSTYRSGTLTRPNRLVNNGNLLITGNVEGGRHFRGAVPYRAPSYFRGTLGSTSLDSFLRRSGSPTVYGNYGNVYEPYFSPNRTVTSLQTEQRGGTRVVRPSDLNLRSLQLQEYNTEAQLNRRRQLLVPDEPLVPRPIDRLGLDTTLPPSEELPELPGLSAHVQKLRDKGLLREPVERETASELPVTDIPIRNVVPEDRSAEHMILDRSEQSLPSLEGQDVLPKVYQPQMKESRVAEQELAEEPKEREDIDRDQIESLTAELLKNLEVRLDGQAEMESAAGQVSERANEVLLPYDLTTRHQDVDTTTENLPQAGLDQAAASLEVADLPIQVSSPQLYGQSSGADRSELYQRTRSQLGLLGAGIGEPVQGNQFNDTSATARRHQADAIMGGEDYATFAVGKSREHAASAERRLKGGKYYGAADSYGMALMYDRDNSVAQGGRGHALFAAGEYISGALFITRSLEACAGKDRSSERSHLAKLGVNFRLIDIDTVEKRILEIKEWQKNSDSVELEFLLGYVYYQMGKTDLARAALTEVQKQMPESAAVAVILRAIDSGEVSGSEAGR